MICRYQRAVARGTVAKAGAHPIMAWTAVHLVNADLRAGRIAKA
jgi:hypothetical protein